jgi:chemosensory pili system protein ChpA (sensor histidine kinase/response regulator)
LSESLPQVTPVLEAQLQDVSVMIVDDSVSVRRALTNLIQYADWTPITARDGVDALETIGDLKTPPHVVLLDVEMPRMDGYELLGILRSKPEFEHTPIIMITSRAGEKHRRKAIELGATAYVVKPFQDEPLLQLMQRHIAQAKKLKA